MRRQQRADGNGTSANDKTTAAWQLIGDWKFWASDEYGETHLAWTAFGAEGLGYGDVYTMLGMADSRS